MNKKAIWIINQYICSPKINGEGHRHHFLSQEFQKSGYETTMITSNFSHNPQRKIELSNHFKLLKENEVDILLVKTPTYKSAKSVGRIWNMIVFMIKLFFIPVKKLTKPDIIIVSSISLLPILNGLYFRMKFNCKLIFEIRDIWPLTLIEIGKFNKNNPFILLLGWVEKTGYKKYDYFTSNLPKTNIHISNRLGHNNFRFKWISNGIDIAEPRVPLSQKLLDQINKKTFNIGYAGSLGQANAMEYLMSAIKKLSDNRNFHFYIAGSGYAKEFLSKEVEGCKNVTFLGQIPKAEVNSFLDQMDLLYISWRSSPLYRFGTSANKIFDYMYSGTPILMSGNIAQDPVVNFNCGLSIKPENSDEIIKAVNIIYNMDTNERIAMGNNGKKAVLEEFTYGYLAKKYISIFKELSN